MASNRSSSQARRGSEGVPGPHECLLSRQSRTYASMRSYNDGDSSAATVVGSPRLGTSTVSATEPCEDGKSRDREKGRPMEADMGYAELVAPMPEVVPTDTVWKEVHWAPAPAAKVKSGPMESGCVDRPGDSAADKGADTPASRTETAGQPSPPPRRIFGLKRWSFWTLIAILVASILGLVLGLGLGYGLSPGSRGERVQRADETEASKTLIGGDIEPSYFTKAGTFNGTGIAVASANNGVHSDIFVFFQRHSGEIVQLFYESADGSWAFVTTVTGNARNATPISVVAYIFDNVATTHIFYLDRENHVRQKTSSNETASAANIWRDGPLNELTLKSHDSSLVGMQACYWGNYYGSASNFNQTRYPIKSEPATGINLFYASNGSTFEQYDWTNGMSAWKHTHSFGNMNTRAGVGCQSWLTNTTTYLAMVDQEDVLRILWRDTDVNKTWTERHPINQWVHSAVEIRDVHPSTSLGFTDFLAYQDARGIIRGIALDWAAEMTSIRYVANPDGSGARREEAWAVDPAYRGIPGTHLAITALDTESGGRQILLFYQSLNVADHGRGISIGLRDSSARGGWSQTQVSVNQTQT